MSLRDILLALLVPVCFGVGFAMAKPAIAHFPPMFLMFLIYAANSILLGIFWRVPSRTPYSISTIIALAAVTLQGLLIFYGYRNISASLATLVIQTQVPFGIILGWLLCGESMNWRRSLGIVIAFSGVGVIVGLPSQPPPLVPLALIIAGSISWALGQVLARKYSRDDGMVLMRSLSIHALPQLLFATLILETSQIDSLFTATRADWLAASTFAFLGFFCGYSLWYSLLRKYPVNDVMPFMLLMPVIGVAVAITALHERLSVANLLGGLIIVIGVGIAIDLSPRVARA